VEQTVQTGAAGEASSMLRAAFVAVLCLSATVSTNPFCAGVISLPRRSDHGPGDRVQKVFTTLVMNVISAPFARAVISQHPCVGKIRNDG